MTQEAQTEDLADLSGLAAGAAEIDGAAKELERAQAVAEVKEADTMAASMVGDLVDALKMARGMASGVFSWWPAFGQVWNDDVINGMAVNGAAIMARHGWTLGELATKWGPYIGLAGCVLPAAVATIQAVRERKATQEAAAA